MIKIKTRPSCFKPCRNCGSEVHTRHLKCSHCGIGSPASPTAPSTPPAVDVISALKSARFHFASPDEAVKALDALAPLIEATGGPEKARALLQELVR